MNHISNDKSKSKDLAILTLNCSALVPVSGTFIKPGINQYLPCINARYEASLPKSPEGYLFPIKIKMSSPYSQLLDFLELTKELIDKVNQFKRL